MTLIMIVLHVLIVLLICVTMYAHTQNQKVLKLMVENINLRGEVRALKSTLEAVTSE